MDPARELVNLCDAVWRRPMEEWSGDRSDYVARYLSLLGWNRTESFENSLQKPNASADAGRPHTQMLQTPQPR